MLVRFTGKVSVPSRALQLRNVAEPMKEQPCPAHDNLPPIRTILPPQSPLVQITKVDETISVWLAHFVHFSFYRPLGELRTKRLDASEYACFGMQAFRPLFLSYNLKKFETEVTAMKRNVSLDKQSKKAQKEYYSGLRRTWNGVDPATRTMPNGKAYNRSKEKHRIGRELRDGFPADSVFFCFLSAETGAIPLPAHLKLYTEPMQKRNAILPDLGYNR